MIRRCTPSLLVALLLTHCLMSGLAPQAAGQPVVLLEEDASRCAMFQALSATLPMRCQGRPRSIVLVQPAPQSLPLPPQHAALLTPPPPAAPPAAPPMRPPRPPAPGARVYAFATRIPFAWDSAQLAPEAHRLLDTLAEVLQDAVMVTKVVRIEGHTDSAGSDAYNRRLSYQRAVAVQRYLHDHHGLPLERLPVVGKGKAEPYDPAHPFDPSNRRVQFVNLTDSPGHQ